MDNLGNTCYLNSLMQVLFTLPPFIKDYVSKAEETFSCVSTADDPANNFQLQMCKLGSGLLSGDYSTGAEGEVGIRPAMFKNFVGRGHPEFSGKGQQDAIDYYLHLLTVIERENKRLGKPRNAFNCLQFEVEDRHECGTTGKVKYHSRVEDFIPIAIPLEAATNKEAVEEWKKKCAEAEAKGDKLGDKDKVRPHIHFDACLADFLSTEEVADFYSAAAKAKTFAKKTMRLKTFPDYLLIQLKKFAVDDNWVPYKLDVEVDMPDELDLTQLTATGLQPGEELIPEEERPSEPVSPKEVNTLVLFSFFTMFSFSWRLPSFPTRLSSLSLSIWVSRATAARGPCTRRRTLALRPP